jgi:hypothetical protein
MVQLYPGLDVIFVAVPGANQDLSITLKIKTTDRRWRPCSANDALTDGSAPVGASISHSMQFTIRETHDTNFDVSNLHDSTFSNQEFIDLADIDAVF